VKWLWAVSHSRSEFNYCSVHVNYSQSNVSCPVEMRESKCQSTFLLVNNLKRMNEWMLMEAELLKRHKVCYKGVSEAAQRFETWHGGGGGGGGWGLIFHKNEPNQNFSKCSFRCWLAQAIFTVSSVSVINLWHASVGNFSGGPAG